MKLSGELLLDTGALVSLLDRSQTHHQKCRRAFAEWTGPLVSTDATHLLAGCSGWTRCLRRLLPLWGWLGEAGFLVEVFHGGLSAAEKDRSMERFEHAADILVSSEVGGEGPNLQFCRTAINYDLPWNPIQLEPRIGGVHRIGQPVKSSFSTCASQAVSNSASWTRSTPRRPALIDELRDMKA